MKTKKFVAKTNFFHKTIFSNIKSFVETIFIIFWMKFIRKIWQKKVRYPYMCVMMKKMHQQQKKSRLNAFCVSPSINSTFLKQVLLCVTGLHWKNLTAFAHIELIICGWTLSLSLSFILPFRLYGCDTESTVSSLAFMKIGRCEYSFVKLLCSQHDETHLWTWT